MACEVLQKAGLRLGCAEHCLSVMAKMERTHSKKERQLLREYVGPKTQAVNANYALGVLYFDKRMLHRSEAYLKWAQERAIVAGTQRLMAQDLQALKQEAVPMLKREFEDKAEAKRDEKLQLCLESLADDLEFLDRSKEKFLPKTEGDRVSILPCLTCRLSTDTRDCDAWWEELQALAESGQIDLRRVVKLEELQAL